MNTLSNLMSVNHISATPKLLDVTILLSTASSPSSTIISTNANTPVLILDTSQVEEAQLMDLQEDNT